MLKVLAAGWLLMAIAFNATAQLRTVDIRSAIRENASSTGLSFLFSATITVFLAS